MNAQIAPQYWNAEGDFSYTGAILSDISATGSTIFSRENAIENIRTLVSEKNFSPKSYIEYPNFVTLQNTEIVAEIRKIIREWSEKNPQ